MTTYAMMNHVLLKRPHYKAHGHKLSVLQQYVSCGRDSDGGGSSNSSRIVRSGGGSKHECSYPLLPLLRRQRQLLLPPTVMTLRHVRLKQHHLQWVLLQFLLSTTVMALRRTRLEQQAEQVLLQQLQLPATVTGLRHGRLQQQAVQVWVLQPLLPPVVHALRHSRPKPLAVPVTLWLAVLLKRHLRLSMLQRHLVAALKQQTSRLQATQQQP
jgi:hypothetical protein